MPEDSTPPGAPPPTPDPSDVEAQMEAMMNAAASGAPAPVSNTVTAAEIEAALNSVAPPADAPKAPTTGGKKPPGGPAPFQTPQLSKVANTPAFGDISFLDDVELDVKVELGRAEIYIEDVLKLGVGSVVELDRLAGDPVDVYVNERLVARGEVLVLNENFCVRINDIISSVPETETGR